MGFIAIGTFTEGWTVLAGEPLPSDLADLEGIEQPEPEYRRPRGQVVDQEWTQFEHEND
jgi:hypothetical protein